jgi:hypothetical protein
MQMKNWLDQQVAEKTMNKQFDRTRDNTYDTQNLELHRQWDVVNTEYEKRRQEMRDHCRNFQLQQHDQKRNKDAIDSLMGDEMGKIHINNCLKDDFYTENTDTCTSSIAPHRVLKYHWKGMDDDQLKNIRLEQERQIADKKMREDMEKEEEKMWALQEETNRRNLLKLQRHHDKAKATRIMDEVVEYNKLKARECERREKGIYAGTHNYKQQIH